MPSYLVTGAAGQLGRCFQYVAAEFQQHRLFFSTHLEVDINQTKTLSDCYEQTPFEGIINCAAYTKVDQAETEQKQAHQTNALGVQNLIDFAELGSALYKSLFPEVKPKVSLLNIGSEEIKGTETLKSASKLLKKLSNTK